MIVKPLFWVLGGLGMLVAIGAPLAYMGVRADKEATAACERKGGVYYAPHPTSRAICLRPNAVVR